MKTKAIKISLFSSLTAFVFVFAYAYPRLLSHTLGENSPWISYLYTYGMGLVFFVLSLILIRSQRINPQRKKQEMYWMIAITCGLLFMFSLHALWIFLSVYFPVF